MIDKKSRIRTRNPVYRPKYPHPSHHGSGTLLYIPVLGQFSRYVFSHSFHCVAENPFIEMCWKPYNASSSVSLGPVTIMWPKRVGLRRTRDPDFWQKIWIQILGLNPSRRNYWYAKLFIAAKKLRCGRQGFGSAHWFNEDSVPVFLQIADPDPVPDPWFWWSKTEKFYSWKKICRIWIFPSTGVSDPDLAF